MIGLAAIGVGLAVALNSNKKDTKLPLPAPTPIPGPVFSDPKLNPGDSTTPVIQPTTETAVSGVKEDTRELSKDQYNSFRRNDWRAILQMKLDAGRELSSATQELFELWNNNNNQYKNYFQSPIALLLGIIVLDTNTARIGLSPVISWNSTPVYDTFSNYWNGVVGWSCAEWRIWHQKMEAYYEDTYDANEVWETAWNHPDNNCMVLGQVGCPDTAYCRYDCDFVRYIKSKGISLGNVFSNTTCTLSDVVLDIVESVEDVGEGIRTTAKIATFAIPIAAGVLAYAWVATTKKRIEKGSR